MLKEIVLSLMLGTSVVGCVNHNSYRQVSQQDVLEQTVQNLIAKHRKKKNVVNYHREIGPIVVSVTKELTGKDVSGITGLVLSEKDFKRAYKYNINGNAGFYDQEQKLAVIKRDLADPVLRISFHEIGHGIIKHIDDYYDLFLKQNQKMPMDVCKALLMEETGAAAYEQWAVFYAHNKFFKNTELGKFPVSGFSKDITLHSVADAVCRDLFVNAMKNKQGASVIELYEDVFRKIDENDFSDILSYLKPKTLEKTLNLFYKMQEPDYMP